MFADNTTAVLAALAFVSSCAVVLFALFAVFLHLRVDHNSTLLLAAGAVLVPCALLLQVLFSWHPGAAESGEVHSYSMWWYVAVVLVAVGRVAEVVGFGWFAYKVARHADT